MSKSDEMRWKVIRIANGLGLLVFQAFLSIGALLSHGASWATIAGSWFFLPAVVAYFMLPAADEIGKGPLPFTGADRLAIALLKNIGEANARVVVAEIHRHGLDRSLAYPDLLWRAYDNVITDLITGNAHVYRGALSMRGKALRSGACAILAELVGVGSLSLDEVVTEISDLNEAISKVG